MLSRDSTISGVCAIRQKSSSTPDIVCCPNRLYAENYEILYKISIKAFNTILKLYPGNTAVEKAKTENGAIAVFGRGWGKELKLPQRKVVGSYFLDWILARLDSRGALQAFTAIEVQTVDTTGNYRSARENLLNGRKIVSDTFGINWENVSKRTIPQLIYKGQIFQREELCQIGLYFVAPNPIYERLIARLGGKEKLPIFPSQPASIHFISYDYSPTGITKNGFIKPLTIIDEHNTTIYKIQEAFFSLTLPKGNIFRDTINNALYSNDH
jgi:hypothetical protein